MYTHIHIYICVYVYMYTYIYNIYIYIYIYIYVEKERDRCQVSSWSRCLTVPTLQRLCKCACLFQVNLRNGSCWNDCQKKKETPSRKDRQRCIEGKTVKVYRNITVRLMKERPHELGNLTVRPMKERPSTAYRNITVHCQAYGISTLNTDRPFVRHMEHQEY